MKKLFFYVLVLIVLMPFCVFAKEKVPVYLFYGDGCPHCAELESFFESLPQEEKDKIAIDRYEVWYSEDNSDIMQVVSDIRGDDATGVPYLIIGERSWVGYASSMDDAIISQIDKVYLQDSDKRYDIADVYNEYISGDIISGQEGDDTIPYEFDDDDNIYSGDNETWIDSFLSNVSVAKIVLFLVIGLVVFAGVVGVVIVIVVLATKKK